MGKKREKDARDEWLVKTGWSEPKMQEDALKDALHDGTADADQQRAAYNCINNLSGMIMALPEPIKMMMFAAAAKDVPPEVLAAAEKMAAIECLQEMDPHGRTDN